MSEWTPGPWKVERGQGLHRFSGVYSAHNGYAIHYKYGSAGEGAAAQDLANAHLIAAAPDLAEALDWLLASVEADRSKENHPGDKDERIVLACGAARTVLTKLRADLAA
jgi:hypothetical protein